MRRPQPAFGLVTVMSSLLVALTFATPASALVAPAEIEPAPVLAATSKQCTKWKGDLTPPNSIRVLRTYKTNPPKGVKGTVVTVPMYEYVATVMGAEWPEHYPLETLKAGAIATKQYAWFYILNSRGLTKTKDGETVCYDVEDSTVDQVYKPETYGPGSDNWPGPKSDTRTAMDATWHVSLRKINWNTNVSKFFLTGYRAGSAKAACGADATGWKLFHYSTKQCGKDGLTYREILRKYLGPNLEIVEPGRENVVGTKHGDARLAQIEGALRSPRVWTPGQAPPKSGSRMGLQLNSDALIGYASGDMNGDGREDLVWLKKADGGVARVKVALSDGVNYDAGELWWSGDAQVSLNGARISIGDFTADQRADVAIIGEVAGGGTRVVVLKRKAYYKAGKFNEPVVWWNGAQEYGRIVGLWTPDLTGDGRADIVVRQHPDSGGVRIKTGVTVANAPAGSRIEGYVVRWENRNQNPKKFKMNVGDANRDGRDDVIALIAGTGRAKLWRFQGQGLGGLKPVKLWTAPINDQVAVKRTRLAVSDIDYDGRADPVLISANGTGTRIRTFKTRYTKLVTGPAWKISVPWADTRLY